MLPARDRLILLVEDEDDLRGALSELLQEEGYQVLTAANGKEALECLSSTPKPCLILLDLMMPVMSGFEFLAARRQDATLAGIPVVLVSAYGGLAEEAPPDEVSGLLGKPLDLDRLLEQVERFC